MSGSRLVIRLRGLADPGRGRDIGIAGGSGYGPHRLGLRRCPSDGHSFAGSSEEDGAAKLVPSCSYPLTGVHCVTRVFSDRGVFLLGGGAVQVPETFGISLDDLRSRVNVNLQETDDETVVSGGPA